MNTKNKIEVGTRVIVKGGGTRSLPQCWQGQGIKPMPVGTVARPNIVRKKLTGWWVKLDGETSAEFVSAENLSAWTDADEKRGTRREPKYDGKLPKSFPAEPKAKSEHKRVNPAKSGKRGFRMAEDGARLPEAITEDAP